MKAAGAYFTNFASKREFLEDRAMLNNKNLSRRSIKMCETDAKGQAEEQTREGSEGKTETKTIELRVSGTECLTLRLQLGLQ